VSNVDPAGTVKRKQPVSRCIWPQMRLTWYLVVLLSGLTVEVMGLEEKVVFKKDLGGGLTLCAVEFLEKFPGGVRPVEKSKPLKPRSLDEVEEPVPLTRFPPPPPPPEYARSGVTSFERVCSFRILGKDLPGPGKVLLDLIVNMFPEGAEKPVSGGIDFSPFEPWEYRIYDAVLDKSRLLILIQDVGNMRLKSVTLDKDFALAGEWSEAKLFGFRWKQRLGDLLPIERGQIIPAGDRVYAFFAGKSGKCMLWEVKGKEAKMVWERDTPPGHKRPAPPPEESISEILEREKREEGQTKPIPEKR